jgi:hypothetical protein
MRASLRVFGPAILAAAAAVASCGGDVSAVTNPTPVTAPPSAASTNAIVSVRCEARSGRSKISVDGHNIAQGAYRATVRSGGHTATSAARNAAGAAVEFDFDSDSGDVTAGANRIVSDFIQGGRVDATLLSASGTAVASTVGSCSWR